MALFPNPYAPGKPKRPQTDPLTALAEERAKQKPATSTAPHTSANTVSAPIAHDVAPTPSSKADTQQVASDAIRHIGGGGAHGGNSITADGPADPRTAALARLQQEHDAENKATMDQLAQSRAQQVAGAAGRAGLAGAGLSGATAGTVAGVQRNADQNATLTLADLHKKQQGEDMDQIQFQAALDDLEASEDRDVDGDGFITGEKVGGKVGDGDPENNPKPSDAKDPNSDANKAANNIKGVDAAFGQPRKALPADTDTTAADDRTPIPGVRAGPVGGLDTYYGSDADWDYYMGFDGKLHKVTRGGT